MFQKSKNVILKSIRFSQYSLKFYRYFCDLCAHVHVMLVILLTYQTQLSAIPIDAVTSGSTQK